MAVGNVMATAVEIKIFLHWLKPECNHYFRGCNKDQQTNVYIVTFFTIAVQITEYELCHKGRLF